MSNCYVQDNTMTYRVPVVIVQQAVSNSLFVLCVATDNESYRLVLSDE